MKHAPLVLLLAAVLSLSCAPQKAPSPVASPQAPEETKKPTKGEHAAVPTEGYRPLPGDETIKNSEVAFNLALEYAGKGDLAAGQHFVDLAINLQPDPKYSYTKGLFYLSEKRYPDAQRWLERALAQGPGTTDNKVAVYNALGAVYMQMGQDDKALEEFRQVVNTPGMISRYESYYNMGVIYLRQEKWLDAEAVLRKVGDENPGYFRAWHKLGLIAGHNGNWEEAATLSKRAIDLVQSNYPARQAEGADIYCAYGEALYQLKRYPESREAFMNALKIAPESDAGRKAKERLAVLGSP